jgi:hypothetical protein
VGIAMVDGVSAAERVTGIPKETVQYWTQKPEFAQLRTTARETVVEQMWIGIQVGIEELSKGLKGDAPLHHKADAVRTLVDRYALLNGEATERHETADVTAKLSDHETAALEDALENLLESAE